MSARGSIELSRRRVVALVAAALSIAAALASPATPARADGDFGPDTCLNGFVWREAVPTDHVCVTPAVRTQTSRDNSLAASRRSPSGGPFGPDTCISGFVWREAFVGDRVCVTPATREQARSDNANAVARRNDLRTTVGTYGFPLRYRVQTGQINVGTARVVLFRSATRTSIRSWRVTVPTHPSAPGGMLFFRTGVAQCRGATNAYFRVQDGSSTRWSARVFVCVTL